MTSLSSSEQTQLEFSWLDCYVSQISFKPEFNPVQPPQTVRTSTPIITRPDCSSDLLERRQVRSSLRAELQFCGSWIQSNAKCIHLTTAVRVPNHQRSKTAGTILTFHHRHNSCKPLPVSMAKNRTRSVACCLFQPSGSQDKRRKIPGKRVKNRLSGKD